MLLHGCWSKTPGAARRGPTCCHRMRHRPCGLPCWLQAAAGVFAHHLSETLPSSLSGLASLAGLGSAGGSAGDSGPKVQETPFSRLSANAGKEFGNRTAEAIATFQQVGAASAGVARCRVRVGDGCGVSGGGVAA